MDPRSEPQREPSTPRYEAEEPNLQELPDPPLPPRSPLRRLIGSHTYPCSRQDLVASARRDPDVTTLQAEWLEAVLPDGRYDRAPQVLDALSGGRLGPPTGAVS